MTAPYTKLVALVSDAIRTVPLSISSTRRSGNGLRNAEEVARAAIAACHVEETRKLLGDCLEKIEAYYKATKGEYPGGMPNQMLVPAIQELLSKLDGQS